MLDIVDKKNSVIPKKGIRSLILLVVWESWNETNARVFRHGEASTISLVNTGRARQKLGSWHRWVPCTTPLQRVNFHLFLA